MPHRRPGARRSAAPAQAASCTARVRRRGCAVAVADTHRGAVTEVRDRDSAGLRGGDAAGHVWGRDAHRRCRCLRPARGSLGLAVNEAVLAPVSSFGGGWRQLCGGRWMTGRARVGGVQICGYLA